jgi:hypothetical protein
MSGWVEAFIVIAAIAIVIQMAILLAMFLQVRAAVQQMTRVTTQLQNRIDPILLRVTRIVDNSEERIASIMSDASELTRLARSQAQKVDRVFTDTLDRVRNQVERADQIVTGALEVIDEAGSTIRRRVWEPVHQASAVLKGIQAGLEFLRGGKRPRANANSDALEQDEELFI